jgi:hypothetical protein
MSDAPAEPARSANRLKSASSADLLSEKPDADMSQGLLSDRSVSNELPRTFSKIITLHGSPVSLQMVIEQSPPLNERDAAKFSWGAEFPVVVARPDNNTIILTSKLPAIQNIKPDDFSAEASAENEIIIRFGAQAAYRVKIDAAASRAIRVY